MQVLLFSFFAVSGMYESIYDTDHQKVTNCQDGCCIYN